jgi:hypothetical protein
MVRPLVAPGKRRSNMAIKRLARLNSFAQHALPLLVALGNPLQDWRRRCGLCGPLAHIARTFAGGRRLQNRPHSSGHRCRQDVGWTVEAGHAVAAATSATWSKRTEAAGVAGIVGQERFGRRGRSGWMPTPGEGARTEGGARIWIPYRVSTATKFSTNHRCRTSRTRRSGRGRRSSSTTSPFSCAQWA